MKTRSTMKVGFIGAGMVTATIGRHLINAGHTIVVSNSRGPETLGKFVAKLGPGAMQEIGAPLSGFEFHFVQRLHRH